MPKVSVLLANYNGEKHLDEAIESVLEARLIKTLNLL